VHILRYRLPSSSRERIGVLQSDQVLELDVSSLASLWSLPLDALRERLRGAGGEEHPLTDVEVLAPIDGRTEVWACGVTYEISRAARVEESERSANVYELVYDAERPELFFKSAGWRVVGDGGTVAVRSDSTIDVPEPEVAVVVNAFGEIVGYTICDDVSSRTIEGENPLYLPQAKIYRGACALGPMVRPAWEVADPYALRIRLTIHRSGAPTWTGTASTAQLHRRYEELVGYLMRSNVHPDGVVLSTGTCLVPPAPFTLETGDVVQIEIDEIGTLTTSVVRGLEAPAESGEASPGTVPAPTSPPQGGKPS
jgi:2-dehydro-3-deoxy-D-arabinonate dehydratase